MSKASKYLFVGLAVFLSFRFIPQFIEEGVKKLSCRCQSTASDHPAKDTFQKIRILSLDGGGVRGVASLELLRNIEKDMAIDIRRDFDVFAGTSTGAIIAVLLAGGRSVEGLIEDYKTLSKEVFSSRRWGFFYAKYKQAPLKISLVKILNSMGLGEDSLLRDLPKKVVIPTVCLNHTASGRPSVHFNENFTEEGGKMKIVDLILQATAAPVYFPSYQGRIDGGVVMNDPSLAGLICAFDWGERDLNNFSLLSVGTGYEKNGIKQDESWGVFSWILDLRGKTNSKTPLLSLIMDVGEQIPNQICKKLLGRGYKKVNFDLDAPFTLDNYENLCWLISYIAESIKVDQGMWMELSAWIKEHITGVS